MAGAGAHVQITDGQPSPLSKLHQLPPPPAIFTGRDNDLADLEKQLVSTHTAGAAISGVRAGLQGMGGVGKSALAIVLAHRLKDRYPDAQLFLNLRGADPEHRPPVAPAEAMRDIILAFHPTAQPPEQLDALTRTYHGVLADAGRVLLLLDNAADAAQVQPLLPPPNCVLLVTSRAQFTLPGLAARHLDCLAPEKSRELLLRLASRLGEHADDAAKLCGHLPLALEVFAGAVNDKKLYPVPELLDRLRARKDKLAPVEAAFELSCELLAEEMRRRWVLLTVFPASFDLRAAAAVLESPHDAYAANRDHEPAVGALPSSPALLPGGEGSVVLPAGAERFMGREMNSARDAMQALVNASLVEWNEAAGRFHLHDLVRQFCESKLDAAAHTAARLRHARHYCAVGDEADALYLRGGDQVLRGLELFDRERAHLEAAFAWLQSQRDRDPAALLVSLVDAVVYTSELRFHPRQRIRWQEGQRDAARLTGNRQAEGSALGNLGLAYAALGDARKAIEFYEQRLVIAREIGDRRGEGADLGNLGLAYARLGDERKAIEFHEQYLVIAREIGDRRGEGNALGNLGTAYAALGDARKAIEFYEQRLVIAREIGDRHGEGNALGNLGNAYADLGDARKAIEFYEQCLKLHREIGDRQGEGNDLGNLGLAYAALGDARKAIEFYEQALVIDREIGDRRGEGTDLWNSAIAFDQLGDRAQAIARAEAALRIYEAIEDPNAAKVRKQLAKWRGR
jgi:tetratricopeptide (TPR) repeat protein